MKWHFNWDLYLIAFESIELKLNWRHLAIIILFWLNAIHLFYRQILVSNFSHFVGNAFRSWMNGKCEHNGKCRTTYLRPRLCCYGRPLGKLKCELWNSFKHHIFICEEKQIHTTEILPVNRQPISLVTTHTIASSREIDFKNVVNDDYWNALNAKVHSTSAIIKYRLMPIYMMNDRAQQQQHRNGDDDFSRNNFHAFKILSLRRHHKKFFDTMKLCRFLRIHEGDKNAKYEHGIDFVADWPYLSDKHIFGCLSGL